MTFVRDGMRSLLGIAFVAGLFVGCFKDGGGNDEAGSSGETGSCADGAQGCDCYGNGTCDPGLECSNDVCVPENCDEGSQDCNCYGNGTCNADLECMGGICVPPVADTGNEDETDTGTETSTETGTTESTDDGMSTDPTVSEVATDSTGIDECDNFGDCWYCIECSAPEYCFDVYDQCQFEFECEDFIDCTLNCFDDQCWSDCQEAFPNGADMGIEVLSCTCDPCQDSCFQLHPYC